MKRKICLLLIAAFALAGCASSTLVTSTPDASEGGGYSTFSFASDFPADIVIPDVDGMRSTAFVLSTSSPAGVLAIDIDARPMVLSSGFTGLVLPSGSGIPSRLVVESAERAFLLTSLYAISFDPRDGRIYDRAEVTEPIDIGDGHLDSDGNLSPSTITPSYPGGIALVGKRLFVSTANFTRTQSPAACAPGTIQVFDVDDDGTLVYAGNVVTSGFNPTGLSSRNGSELIVVNTGVLDIIASQGTPRTASSIDAVDPEALVVKATIEAGLSALAPYGMDITIDGSRGFIGSASFGEVYEVDLINRRMLRGLDDPISVTGGSDYINAVALSMDDTSLYAASFEESSAVPVEIGESDFAVGSPFVVGFPSGVTEDNPSGANTGAGPLAIRPGSRGTDYQGEDLFVLTGYPGTLVAIDTGAPAQAFVPEATDAEDDEVEVPNPPAGSDGEACNGFAQAVVLVDYGDGAGFGQSLMDDVVLGPPRGNGAAAGGLHVLSLGSGGEITIDLGNCPAVDGAGVDFIVFENAFYVGGDESAPYAELAAVAVSDDGVNFTEFPCSQAAYPYDGCAGWHAVYSNPANSISPFDPDAAGGDAFDLADIGVAKARYIRITDDADSGALGTTAGFDLDAVSVVNGEIAN